MGYLSLSSGHIQKRKGKREMNEICCLTTLLKILPFLVCNQYKNEVVTLIFPFYFLHKVFKSTMCATLTMCLTLVWPWFKDFTDPVADGYCSGQSWRRDGEGDPVNSEIYWQLPPPDLFTFCSSSMWEIPNSWEAQQRELDWPLILSPLAVLFLDFCRD